MKISIQTKKQMDGTVVKTGRVVGCAKCTFDDVIERALEIDKSLTKEHLVSVIDTIDKAVIGFVEKGNIVHMKLFSIYPGVVGKVKEAIGEFLTCFKARLNLRPSRLLKDAIAKVPLGLASTYSNGPAIKSVLDSLSNKPDACLTPGGFLEIRGNKIKLAGDSPAVGVYFTNLKTKEEAFVDITKCSTNKNGTVILIIPRLKKGAWGLKIKTQYLNYNTLLDEPRTITYEKPLSVAS